ncbi:MAG: arsenate reductase ArsC [Gammaproteobacteria bacterium]|nr:arsenate reductase ArsC [Gammaproteobacteria bacterium]
MRLSYPDPDSTAMGRIRAGSVNTPLRVLMLCTANSARSQIAEALLRHCGAGRVEAGSAGATPAGRVHPAALGVLERHGVPAERLGPKATGELLGREWDVVITVCDRARDACPVLPRATVSAHWGMPDPARVTGTGEAAAFDEAFRTLRRRIDAFLALRLEELDPAALGEALTEIGS